MVGHNHKDFSDSLCCFPSYPSSLPGPSSPLGGKSFRRINSISLGIALTSSQNNNSHIYNIHQGFDQTDFFFFVATQFSESLKFLRCFNLLMQYSLSYNTIESKILYFPCVVLGYLKNDLVDLSCGRTIIFNKNLNIQLIYFLFLGVRNNQVPVYRYL